MSGKDADANDAVTDQIAAFEKLLRHAMARFSKERLYDMLQTVNEDTQASVRYPKSARTAGEAKKPSTAPVIKIKSVAQVKTSVKTFEKKGEKNWSEKERQAIKYFEVFQKDISYLGDLKKYFMENVHSVLLKDYFDPADRVRKSPTARSDTGSNGARGLTSRGSNKSFVKSTKKSPVVTKSDAHVQEKQRLSEIITEMDEINSKWSGLLADRDLNPEDFDPDSHHELTQFSNFAAFEPILRLVPDVFVKCYKAVDVAREWWKLASIIYAGRLPLKSKRPSPTPSPAVKPPTPKPEDVMEDFSKSAKDIKRNITEIADSIRENEMKLENLGEEMKSLETRDDRIEDLTNGFERMDTKLKTAQDEYSSILEDRQRTVDEISKVPRGSDQHYDLTKRKNSMDLELQKHQNKLRLLEFEKSVVQEDYLLELELRPTFIHFLGDIKQQIDEIKEDIANKQTEKSQLEKQLALLKTNADEMKVQMEKFLSSNEDSQLSRQLSKLTKEIEDDLMSLQKFDNERTFVSISDDVELDEYLTGDKAEVTFTSGVNGPTNGTSHSTRKAPGAKSSNKVKTNNLKSS